MDLNNHFIRNEIRVLGDNLNALKDSILLIQQFLQAEFGRKFKDFCEAGNNGDQNISCRSTRNGGRTTAAPPEILQDPLNDDYEDEGDDNPVIFNMLEDEVQQGQRRDGTIPSSSEEEEDDDYADDPSYTEPPETPITFKTEQISMDKDEDDEDEFSKDHVPSRTRRRRGGAGRRGPSTSSSSSIKKTRARLEYTKIASFTTYEEAVAFVKNKDGGGVWFIWKKYAYEYPGDKHYFECQTRRRRRYEMSRRKKYGLQGVEEELPRCNKMIYIMKPKVPGKMVDVYEDGHGTEHPCLANFPLNVTKKIDPGLKKTIENMYNGGLKKAKYVMMELKERGMQINDADRTRIRNFVQFLRRAAGDAATSQSQELQQETTTSGIYPPPPPKRKRQRTYTPTGKPRGRPTKYGTSTVSSTTTTTSMNSMMMQQQGLNPFALDDGSGVPFLLPL